MKFYHGGREFFAKAFTQNFSHKGTKDTEKKLHAELAKAQREEDSHGGTEERKSRRKKEKESSD